MTTRMEYAQLPVARCLERMGARWKKSPRPFMAGAMPCSRAAPRL